LGYIEFHHIFFTQISSKSLLFLLIYQLHVDLFYVTAMDRNAIHSHSANQLGGAYLHYVPYLYLCVCVCVFYFSFAIEHCLRCYGEEVELGGDEDAINSSE